MVAKLFFPDFTRHHSSMHHRHLAGVVEISAKMSDSEFRMKSTIRHAEELSTQCWNDFSKQWVHSAGTGIALSKAWEEGSRAFWNAWFSGFMGVGAPFSKATPETSESRLKLIAKG